MKFVEYPDRDMMMIDLANVMAGELNAALHANDTVSLAVPGGTTPGPLFDGLCAADIDWSRVVVIPTDERWVPGDHARSNARLIGERLLTDRAAAASLLPLYTGDATPEEGAPALSDRLARHLPVSVMLLGMGGDMHTASLFPGAEGLAAALDPQAPAVCAIRSPDAGEPRVSLSLPVLQGAVARHVLITGADKRAALDRARDLNDPLAAPVSAVLAGATVHWAE